MAITRSTYRYFVELWAEPRDIAGLPLVVRGRVRDLANRKERYVTSIEEIVGALDDFLDADGVRPRVWEVER